MVILCGPNWTPGEHKLSVKAKASNGKELELGTANVNIPNGDFVYNAFLNNIKITMDYSVNDVTFYVYDDGKEVIARKYPVIPMLVPQKQAPANAEQEDAKDAKKDKKKKEEEV